MLNRIKNWDYKNINISQNNIVTLAMVLSIMALVMSIPSSSNCASADSCTVSSTGTFTGNMALKSGTNYTLTQQHAYSQNVIANWQDVGGTHTGTVIMKDNAGDFNLGGGIILATSATTTTGALRFDSGNVEVYNGGWSAVGGTPTNDIGTVAGDTGSFSAVTPSDTLNVVGAGSLSTAVVGDTLTISSSAGTPSCSYYAYSATTAAVDPLEGVRIDTEYYDPDNCFTLFGSVGNNYGITYNGTDTLVFDVNALVNFTSGSGRSMFQYSVNATQTISYMMADGQSGSQLGHSSHGLICLNQNDTLSILFGNTASNDVQGGFDYGFLKLDQNLGIQAHATSQTCTNGLIN